MSESPKPSIFEELLARIARGLDRSDLPYMVIGGQAVLLYGEPRLTKDIDITLGATLERLEDVVEVAEEIELAPLVTPDTFTRETMVLPCQHPESGIRVDFIFSFSPYERQALERAQSVEMEGEQVRFASLEDVIIHKIVAGRPRDLEDVKSMLVKNEQADSAYIREWLGEFSSSLDESFVATFDHILRESW